MKTTNQQNIAVVGAGIMGLMNALTLAQAGHLITIYDPAGFKSAGNASALAGGMLAPYSEIEHMPMAFVQAGLDGIAMWHALLPSLATPVDFVQGGSLFVAHSEDSHMLERFAAHLPPEAEWRHVNRKDIETLEPHLLERFSSGLLIEKEAHIYPAQAMEALVIELRALNITFIEKAADPSALSKDFDYIIDCRGYGAEADNTDMRGVKGELAIVENPDFSLSRAVRLMHPRYPLYIVPRPDNVFMIGATLVEGAEDERVSLRSAMELLSALYSLHPSFGEAKILEITAGIRPSYMDNLPRISVRGNVVTCNGLFRHGYLLSPTIAKDVCEIVIGRHNRTSLFIEEHRPERAA